MNERKEFYVFMSRHPGVKEWGLSAEPVTNHPDQKILMEGVDAVRVREILPEDEVWLAEVRHFDQLLAQNKELAKRVFELEKELRTLKSV